MNWNGKLLEFVVQGSMFGMLHISLSLVKLLNSSESQFSGV